MASSAKHIPFFVIVLIITILSSSMHITYARDSQLFNKIPSTTNKDVVVDQPQKQQQDQEPKFLPQNEESYGLYGHETGQLPPSTTTNTPLDNTHESKQTPHKYLPKNYNPVAYVTVPENTDEDTSSEFTEERGFDENPNTNTNNYDNNAGEESYYNSQLKDKEFSEYRYKPTTTTSNRMNNNNNKNYYSGQQQNEESELFSDQYRNNKYEKLGSDFNSPRENVEGFKPQGMSDTRFLENGKYHYDINTGRFSSNHPYERLKGFNSRDNNEFVNKNYNYNQYNDDQLQGDDDNMP